jgi:Zn-dependent M28 family amino/carboxypeptidase
MIRAPLAALLLAAAGPALAAGAPPADPAATAAALRDKALADPTAYEIVSSLTTEIGGRPAGSPAAAAARDWGVAKLKALGFENVHVEPFPITAWARGPESAEIVGPVPRKLKILGLGRSPSTPPGGIEAPIALFHSYADLLAAPPGSLTGKIAVVTQPMTRTQDGSGYGAGSTWRTRGAREAALRGAVAYLVRSISTSDSRLPHTGAMSSEGPLIPAAALGVPDAELLERLAATGRPVRVRLDLSSTTTPNAPAWNVVGEIRGRDKPDEVVVIGGHLDSWDPGEGAIDDGAGVAITAAAAHLISELPQRPRRTIRVVMFGDEEMDFSGKAYAAAHKDEAAHIVAVGESDLGSDPIWSLQLPKGAAGAPQLKPLASVLAPLKIFVAADPTRFSGSDFAELNLAGVPGFSYRQEAGRYFDIHHSADDTLNKVDPVSLRQNVGAWAALVYLIADSDIDFRALAAAEQGPAPEHP